MQIKAMAEMSSRKSTTTTGNVNGGTATATAAGTAGATLRSRKSSKNETIRAAVGNYLRQKQYVANDKYRKILQLQQSKKQFIISKLMESDVQMDNFFTYSNPMCLTNNPHVVDQQFHRFSQFVESQSDNNKRQELRRFYGPLLCHLYLELIKAREANAALEFLRKYAYLIGPLDNSSLNYENNLPILNTKINGCAVNTTNNDISNAASNTEGYVHHGGGSAAALSIRFASSEAASAYNHTENPEKEYFMRLVKVLSLCTRLEMLENHPELCHFVSSKYEIYTTEAVLDALVRFLETRGHVLILNTLYTWIQVHTVDNELTKWSEDKLFLPSMNGTNIVGSTNDEDDDDDLEDNVHEKLSTRTHTASRRRTKSESTKTDKAGDTGSSETQDQERRVSNLRTCLDSLRASREKIQKAQVEFPRFIKIAEKRRGLTSADLDTRQCHLVAGFNNSVVQLWQMDQQVFRSKTLYRPREEAECPYELNNCCKETEDSIEVDVRTHTRLNLDRRKCKYDELKYEDNSLNEFGGIQLRGHGLGVTDVRFSMHYPLIYSVSKDTTMRTWRANTYACAAIYRGHRYPIWCLDESPCGLYVVTGSKDLTARLWSLERESPYITYVGHTQDVECIAFHPNGNYLATGSADLSVRLWCTTSGELVRMFNDCKQAVTCLTFSPDGKMLAAAGEESKIRIFDLAAGVQLNELKEHSARVASIAWSENGRHLASVCRDGSFRLWDVKRLHAISDSTSSTSSSSSSSSPSRLMALGSKCERLVKVFMGRSGTISCLGS